MRARIIRKHLIEERGRSAQQKLVSLEELKLFEAIGFARLLVFASNCDIRILENKR